MTRIQFFWCLISSTALLVLGFSAFINLNIELTRALTTSMMMAGFGYLLYDAFKGKINKVVRFPFQNHLQVGMREIQK